MPFEPTFAGMLASAYRERSMAVRNLGTANYSPIIYHRKIEEAVRRLDIKPREIVVFLDISDIHNDVTRRRSPCRATTCRAGRSTRNSTRTGASAAWRTPRPISRRSWPSQAWNCTLTLVVYPWPDQIASGDRDSSRCVIGATGRTRTASASSTLSDPRRRLRCPSGNLIGLRPGTPSSRQFPGAAGTEKS